MTFDTDFPGFARLLAAALVVAGALCVSSCRNPRSCQDDEECPGEEICRNGLCTSPGESGGDSSGDDDGSGGSDGDDGSGGSGGDSTSGGGDGGSTTGGGDGGVPVDSTSGPCGGSLRSCPTSPECGYREDESRKLGCVDDEEGVRWEASFGRKCFCKGEANDEYGVYVELNRQTQCDLKREEVRVDMIVDIEGCNAEEFESIWLDTLGATSDDRCPTEKPLPGEQPFAWCSRHPSEGRLVVHWRPGESSNWGFRVKSTDQEIGFAYTVDVEMSERK